MTEATEALHLRQVIEKQPSCLLRIARDGTLLACNDAGLSLLGKHELAEVLDRAFADHLGAEHRAEWREFADRVWADSAGSFECDLGADAGGRTVLLQAVALRNHPDGLESMLIAARDMSQIRRLEGSLHAEHDVEPQSTDAEARIQAALAEQQLLLTLLEKSRDEQHRFAAALEEHDTEAARTAEEHRQTEASLRAQLSDVTSRLETVVRDHHHLTAQLNASLAEQDRLTSALRERDHEHEARVEAARRKQEVEHDGQMRERVGALEAQLASTRAERERVAAALDEQRATGAQAQLAAEELRRQIADLGEKRAIVASERDRLTARVEELDGKWRQAEAERDGSSAARAAAERQLEQLRAEARERAAFGDTLAAQLAAAAAEHETVRAQLERALADARAEVASHQADSERRLTAENEATVAQRATLANHQVVKTVADQRVELDQWRTLVSELEPLASAGRLAIQLARELHKVMSSLENRAGLLLAVSPLDASYRPEIESLRADMIRAASLARQLVRSHADAPPGRETV